MKDGYYWVKINKNSKWMIQEIKSDVLHFHHNDISYPANLVYTIGDYIETPDKYKEQKSCIIT